MKDFYYILGVNSNSTLDEIKEAYRKLSKKFHPDLNQGDAYFEDRFKEINEAFETLCDPGKRSRYDEALKQFKSKPGNEGDKRQRHYYYYQQNQQQRRHARRSAPVRKKGPGVGMSVILILIGVIVSIYMVGSFSSSKKIKVNKAEVPVIVPYKGHKHHKRKHYLKSGAAVENAGINSNDKPAPADIPKKPETIHDKLPVPAVTKNPNENDAPSYAYVRANITGVINLRKVAEYGAQVIATIPANARVLVLQKGNDYDKVSYNNNVGYVPAWSVKITK